jgi:hypothetical protein
MTNESFLCCTDILGFASAFFPCGEQEMRNGTTPEKINEQTTENFTIFIVQLQRLSSSDKVNTSLLYPNLFISQYK